MCFFIDVNVLLMVIGAISAQRGKDSFDHKCGSFSFDW